jgi:uncharacterized protein (TIGR02145 family)
MKKQTNYLIYPLLIMGFLSLLLSSCKKDEKTADSSVKDIDGNVYKTVTIGTQVWMVENLKVTKYNDGTAIPNVTENSAWALLTTGAYCNYDNTESYSTTYGRLYNFYAVKTGKLAPTGWHIPSKDEWSTLIAFLGGEGIAGGKLKATGSSWATPNGGATNETGFTGLPGGDRSGKGWFASDGGHYSIGEYGIWWSSSADAIGAWHYVMYFDDSTIDSDNSEYEVSYYHLTNNQNFAKSVRCIKD